MENNQSIISEFAIITKSFDYISINFYIIYIYIYNIIHA